MRAMVVILLVATSLAGCSDEPDPEQQFVEAIEQGVAADLPPWEVGMWWEYETTGGISKFVVTGESGANYIVDTNDRQTAFYVASVEEIAFLGEIRKSDLAGFEDGQEVVMFDWPLTEDKEWQTTWDGDTLNMVANAMGENQFHVMGHRASDGQMAVEYHYNANVAWFEYIIFYGETGEEVFRLSLRDSGFDYSGQVYRYTVEEWVTITTTAQDSGLRDISISDEYNEINFTFVLICGGDAQGSMMAGLNSPEGRDPSMPMLPFVNEPEHGHNHDCDSGPHSGDFVVVPNQGGLWEYGAIVGAANGRAMLHYQPRIIETITL